MHEIQVHSSAFAGETPKNFKSHLVRLLTVCFVKHIIEISLVVPS